MNNCIICKSEKICSFFVDPPRDLYRCDDCGHIFSLDKINYSNRGIEYFNQNYNHQKIYNISDSNEWDKFVSCRLWKLLQHHRFIKNMNIVELGCMEGQILHRLQKHGHTITGYEPIKEMAKSYPFIKPTAIEDDNEIIHGIADLVYSFHVFEHLPDPVRTVDTIHTVLKLGGRLFIETPFEDIDYWNPDHLHWYTMESYGILLQEFHDIKIMFDYFVNINKVKVKQIQISGAK